MVLKKDEEPGMVHYIIMNFKRISGKELTMSSIESIAEIFRIKHLLIIETEEHLPIIEVEVEERLPILEVEDEDDQHLHHSVIHLIQMHPIFNLHLMRMLQMLSR